MFQMKYLVCLLFVKLLFQSVGAKFCSTGGEHKCSIDRRDCSTIPCTYNLDVNDWRHRSCIGCSRPKGTKVIWTFDNNSSIPPNHCIKFDIMASLLILPSCYVNKQLNEGKYICTIKNITNDEIIQPPEIFDMKVSDAITFDDTKQSNELVNLTCPYTYCVKKYYWSYSKTADGIFGALPQGISSHGSYIFSRQMNQEIAGYYKCTASSSTSNPISIVTQLRIKDSNIKISKALFTVCSQRICASSNKDFEFMCKGNISNVQFFSSAVVSASCPSLKNVFMQIFDRSVLVGFIRNGKPFTIENQGIRFSGNTTYDVFEIHFRIGRDDYLNGTVACNFTIDNDTPGLEYRSFRICFYKEDWTSLIINICIPISIALVSLTMILAYRHWEYEIRLFIIQECPFYRSKRTRTTWHKVLLAYAKSRESFAENVENVLIEKIPGISVSKMWDSIPGEDVSSTPTKAIRDSDLVLILLEMSAFNCQPSLFEDVLKLSYDNNRIQRMYIILDKGKFSPPQSFRAAKAIKADLASFRARDRVVKWHGPLEDNVSCQDTLLKKLRFCMEEHSRYRERTFSERTNTSSLSDLSDGMRPGDHKRNTNPATVEMVESAMNCTNESTPIEKSEMKG